MDWAIKYSPKSPAEYAGSKSIMRMFSGFIDRWEERNQLKNGLILHGEPGNGKTSLIYAMENILNLNIIELNSSNSRNVDDMRKLQALSGTQSHDGKMTVILLDEADGIKAWKVVEEFLPNAQCPIIFTCNYIDKIPWEVTKECITIEVQYPTNNAIVKRLGEIAKKENIIVKKKLLEIVATKCNSMRQAILTFQRVIISGDMKRIVPQDIDYGETEQIKRLFSGKDVELTIDIRTIRKWAIVNDINLHKLDYMTKLARETPGAGPILDSYVKTLRGDTLRLKSPYYRKFTPRKKKVEEEEDDDKEEFVAPKKKQKTVEKASIENRMTFEDESIW